MATEKKVKRGSRKERKGVVVSRSGDKTAIVLVERRVKHELYGKIMKRSRKFHAHDEKNEAAVGSTVKIVECRPISKMKRWRVKEVLASAAE